ncbi:polyprenyl synthetase family protein [Streptomyces ehimensis]|uniref:Polyprenyl synthetase family protein n=1 Tax=Streptomyces ehimensis TaxID=68195 RepID=A0ABV9BVY7_9ACTN
MSAPTPPLTPAVDLAGTREAVDTCLTGFLDRKMRAAASEGMPTEAISVLRRFLTSGGKRLRPLLCVCGWCAAGGHGDTTTIVRAAASLEMFHAFALIHDDVMDRAATRRGAPTVHRRLARHHREGRSMTAARHLGVSTAVLVGDLALAWSDELLPTVDLTSRQLGAVLPLIDVMRSEVMYGQYLDVTAAGHPTGDVEYALRIARYKTAKYTVERPLHIGAAMAGAPLAVREALSAFALPVGEAFQLRDDLLGVFGKPEITGKPSLDDLREGKHTVLVALALERATPSQRHILDALLGNPDLDDAGADRIRRVLTATGARAEAEHMIIIRRTQALRVLEAARLPPAATAALRKLTGAATARTS